MASWLYIEDEAVAPLAAEPAADPVRGEWGFSVAALALPERRSLAGDVSVGDEAERRPIRCLTCRCENALLHVRAWPLAPVTAPDVAEDDDHLLVDGEAALALGPVRFGVGRRGPCLLELPEGAAAELPLTARRRPEPCAGCPVPEHIATPVEPPRHRFELLRLRQRRRVELKPFALERSGRLIAHLGQVRRLSRPHTHPGETDA